MKNMHNYEQLEKMMFPKNYGKEVIIALVTVCITL